MPLHPAAQTIVDMIPTDMEMPEITLDNVEIMRELMGSMNTTSAGTGPDLSKVEDRLISGPGGELPIRIYNPEVTGVLPVTMWFHGGGFFAGSIEEHDTACRHLASEAGSIVVSVGYRLAPEHRYPAAVDDCYAALQWVAANTSSIGAEPGTLAVAGDSAGGNLAAVVALRARDSGPDLRFQVLVYPVLDSSDDSGTTREFHLLSAGEKASALRVYAGDADLDQPEITPIHAELNGLPPALIITAEYDALCLDGEAYAERLRTAGVTVTLSQYDGMVHGFFTTGGMFDDAQVAAAEAGAALRAAFESAPSREGSSGSRERS